MKYTPAIFRGWHTWFAWYPVWIWEDESWHWLEKVERMRCDGPGREMGYWDYRSVPSQLNPLQKFFRESDPKQ